MNIDTFCVSTTYLQTNALLLMAVRSYHKNNAPSQGGYVVAYRLIQPLTRQLTACYKTFNYNDVHHCATDCMLIDTATAILHARLLVMHAVWPTEIFLTCVTVECAILGQLLAFRLTLRVTKVPTCTNANRKVRCQVSGMCVNRYLFLPRQ